MVCHELTVWQAVTGGRMVYLQSIEALSGCHQPVEPPECRSRCIGPSVLPGNADRSCVAPSEISLTTPGLDLATRLRVFQRALRSRVERRDALIDIIRAVNTTLEPAKIAEEHRRTRRDLAAGAVLGRRLVRSVRASCRCSRIAA